MSSHRRLWNPLAFVALIGVLGTAAPVTVARAADSIGRREAPRA